MEIDKMLEDTIRQLKQTQRIAKIGNWHLDFGTGVATWSEEACRIYGLGNEECIHSYDEWEGFVHPEDLPEVQQKIREGQQSLADYSVVHRIILKDGTIRNIFTTVEFAIDNQGVPTGLNGISHDITDIMKIRNSLSKSEANIGLMMDLIPLSIYARDANGDYLFANRVFLNHYGIEAHELAGKNMRDFVRSEEEFKVLSKQDQSVLQSDEKLIVSEFCQTDHAGRKKYWRIIKVPFTPDGFENKAILGIAEDITEQKNYEHSLIGLTKSLQDRNEELEKFSQMVSHDLRGPLATLMGITDLIENVKLEQEEISEFLSGTRIALLKLDTIVRQMNDVLERKE
jgi:PAS domain S-box-containing protein